MEPPMNSDEIRIVPQNPLDLRPEELEGLAEALRAKMPNLPVRIVAQPQHGYGVTFWEVLRVWVPWSDVAQDAAAAAVGIIAKELVSWARHRFKKSPGRPKYVAILGPNGEVLKSVRLEGRGKTIDMTAEDRETDAKLRPPD